MSEAAAILSILAAGAGGAALSWLIRRLVRLEVRRRHHDVGSAVFLQLGVIFAVLLAFIFSEVWTEYNTAAAAINGECGALHGATMLAATLPAPAPARIEDAAAAYLREVIGTEWPDMARGVDSRRASNAFRRLYQEAARLDPATPTAEAARTEMLSLLAEAHAQRETRLFQMTLGVPLVMWSLLLVFSAVLVVFVAFSAVDSLVPQMAFTALFAGMVAFILVVVRMLDYPFHGALALPSADFQATLAKVLALAGG